MVDIVGYDSVHDISKAELFPHGYQNYDATGNFHKYHGILLRSTSNTKYPLFPKIKLTLTEQNQNAVILRSISFRTNDHDKRTKEKVCSHDNKRLLAVISPHCYAALGKIYPSAHGGE